VEETGHLVVGSALVLLGVGTDLVGVHAHHGDLDRTSKVEVVVAQVIGRCLEILLVQCRGVVGNSIEDWLSSGYCGLVRNKVEIEKTITLELNDSLVDTCAGARVEDIIVALLVEESVLNVAVNQAVDNLGLVACSSGLKHVTDDLNFVVLDLLGHGGTTHTVSVDDNLLR
jgi:hypothetical protein